MNSDYIAGNPLPKFYKYWSSPPLSRENHQHNTHLHSIKSLHSALYSILTLIITFSSFKMLSTIKFGYSGLGPRNQIKLAMSVLHVLIHRDDLNAFAEKHGKFTFTYDVFEQQQQATGGGNAFQHDSEGMINGGLGAAAVVKGADTLPDRYRDLIDDICNLPKRVAEKAKTNRAEIALEYARVSAVAAIMFDHAFDADGNLNTNVECGTRGFVGQVAKECFDRVLAFAREELSDLVKITIHSGATVLDVDIQNPQRPALTVEMQDGITRNWTFDFVSLAHGTAQRVPVSGHVSERSYTGTPNFAAIKSFLAGFDLLDEKALLKPGSTIATGGLSLAMIDMLMILLRFTGIVVQDTTTKRGYRIDEAEAEKYRAAFIIFNREPGALSGLRVKYDQAWEGVVPLLTPEEVHAAWMHDQSMLPSLLKLGKADVAASCGKKPSEINRAMSTEERLNNYNRQINTMHAAAAVGDPNLTENGLFRAVCQSILNGQGLANDPAAAEANLSEKYPISRAATAGWPIQRALPYAATRFDEAVRNGNRDFFKGWGEVQNIVASAPWACLSIMADLVERDVIRYVKGSYEEVKFERNALNLHGDHVDVLFAPKIIDGNADALLSKLRVKVRNEAMQPVFAKGRYYIADNGDVTHVCDAGLVGHGSRVETLYGQPATIGVSWADTNARLSALQRAPAAALTELAAALRIVSGNRTPLVGMGAQAIDRAAYGAEMEALRQHFDTLQEKLRLLPAAEIAADASPGGFADYHALLATQDGRARLEEKLKDTIRLGQDLAPKLESCLSVGKGTFSPLKSGAHGRRFVDFNDSEAEGIFAAAIAGGAN